MNLLIVESPTKAKTLSRFLGDGYTVEATMGHIKDLPKSKLGVDVEDNFKPDYQEVAKQAKIIKTLQKEAKKASGIFLATDPDREGEAISEHVKEILLDNKISEDKIKRIVFHEITKQAVEHAIESPRKVDAGLVDAQIARRVLDRLVGYKLSPLLWKKVRRGLSAGRVQTVTVRLIVEREREIEAFKPVEYWEIGSLVLPSHPAPDARSEFLVSLAKINDKKAEVKSKAEADTIVSDLTKAEHKIEKITKKEVKKNPYAPFTTSTLSQAGANLFGWSSKRTMAVAQKLYEQGLITYHRTDSINLSATALSMARDYIKKEFGEEYLPEKPRAYKTKSKSAQEAHEAIRPTNLENKGEITDAGQQKLYELIWKRFLACQMSAAVYDHTSIDVRADKYILRTTGQIIKFDGWRKVMPARPSGGPARPAGGPQKAAGDEQTLPNVNEGDVLSLVKVISEQKFTQPPARFNEASIIKTLEKLGIGRPSTYAPTISTVQARGYIEKTDGKFFPTPVGITVNDFLLSHFPSIFEYSFTAQMEGKLDEVAGGKLAWSQEIKEFWGPFNTHLEDAEKNAQRVKIPVEKLNQPCPLCGKDEGGELVIRSGRFGKFISCSRFPDCKHTDKFLEKIGMKCPKCEEDGRTGEKQGEVIVKKTGKGRKFFGCSKYPECDYASWKNPKLTKENPTPNP